MDATGPLNYPTSRLRRNQIRILCILPDKDRSSEVYCELETRALDDHPPYNALSYCCGVENDGPVIHVVGEVIPIKPNLFAALKQLRHENERQYLWVDALCINQSDDDEKAEQILSMDRIYRGANIVYAWLGEEDHGSENAMAFLQIMQRSIFENSGNELLRVMRSEVFAIGWMSLIELLRRPYWTRAWIAQEVLLSKNVMVCCGKHRVAWPAISAFLLYIVPSFNSERLLSSGEESAFQSTLQSLSYLAQEVGLLSQFSEKYQNILEALDTNGQVGRGSLDLLNCLTMSRRRFSTDRSDYVYSVLSLSNTTFLKPTYKRTSSWLFKELVVRDIAVRGNLSILSGCKHFSEEERHTAWQSTAKFDLEQNDRLSKELELDRHPLATFQLDKGFNLGAHPIWYEKTQACLESWYRFLITSVRDIDHDQFASVDPEQSTRISFEKLTFALRCMREYRQDVNSDQAQERVLEFERVLHRFCMRFKEYISNRSLNAALPTWAPNWTLPISSLDQNILLHDESQDLYHSSRDTAPGISFDNEMMSMFLRAIPFEKIAHIPRFQITSGNDPLVFYWTFWLKTIESQKLAYGDRRGQMEAFRRLVTLGRGELSLQTLARVILMQDQCDKDEQMTTDKVQTEILTAYKNWTEDVNRQFFITHSGYIGAGPQSIREGDLVVVPLGSKVPFILRENGDSWYLIEECYVQGIMNGEIFEHQEQAGMGGIQTEFHVI